MPSGAPQGWLQDPGAAGAQERGKLDPRGQPLSGGDGNTHRLRHMLEFQQVVRRDRLFEPERRVGLQRLSQTNGAWRW